MIAPHKVNRKKASTQDGRALRRYRRRWKIERLFAWLQNFRRIQVRHDRILENYLGFVLLGCIIIFLDHVFEMTSTSPVGYKQVNTPNAQISQAAEQPSVQLCPKCGVPMEIKIAMAEGEYNGFGA